MSAVLIGYGNQDVLYMLAELCSRLSYFHLLSLAATADHLPPPHPIPSILLHHANPLHVLVASFSQTICSVIVKTMHIF